MNKLFIIILVLLAAAVFFVMQPQGAPPETPNVQDPTGSKAGPPVISDKLIYEKDIHSWRVGEDLESVLKLQLLAIDSERRKLYVPGSSNTHVAIIDLDTERYVGNLDTGGDVWGVSLDKNGYVYVFSLVDRTCKKIDVDKKEIVDDSVEMSVCDCLMDTNNCKGDVSDFIEIGYRIDPASKTWGGYLFRSEGEHDSGTFIPGSSKDLNGAYNRIGIYRESNTGTTLGEIIHGPEGLFFVIDQKTGMLYGSNVADGSVSVFDLNKLEYTNYCENDACWVKDIIVGTGIDSFVVDSNENIYIRNRVGGSEIYKYNHASDLLNTFENENEKSSRAAIYKSNGWEGGLHMWPMGIALSSDESEILVMSHYGVLVDVLEVNTGKVKYTVQHDTSVVGRSDQLSEMKYDKERNIVYGAWSELGLVIAFDMDSKTTKSLDLYQYGFNPSKELLGGPGHVNIAMDEITNKLYVYLKDESKLIRFDASSFIKEKEASLALGQKGIDIMIANGEKRELYLRSNILDMDMLSVKDDLLGVSIIAFDNDEGALYVSADSIGGDSHITTVYKYREGYETGWVIGDYKLSPFNYQFDFENDFMFVADFGRAVIKKFDISSGDDVELPQVSVKPGGGPERPPGNQPPQEKCGDGTCDDIELQTGMCQQDCL